MRKELARISPAEVNLSASAIMKYIDALESSGSELHGIMIARYGKVCAEGWWKPYSPMLRHGLQSLTKSYVSTAIGLLIGEQLLKLGDKLVDILPEYMPEHISDNLRLLSVHDLLCMSSGLETMQDRTKTTWVKDFFASQFINRPGSKFYYSGVVTSILGVIVRKKTGLCLMDYLKPRLFDKIGILAENLKWLEHPDGLEYGGGGLFATTEDNLRLGLLYLNGGTWDGERIISKEWVNKASSKQIDNSGEVVLDVTVGYGYQMWMCKPQGVYRFDGAHGQFTIMIPELDMVISINQFADGTFTQKTLDITWEYLKEAIGIDNRIDSKLALERRMSTLSLPRAKVSQPSENASFLVGKRFILEDNGFFLLPEVYEILSYKIPKGIKSVSLEHGDGEILAEFSYGGGNHTIHISTDGVDRLSKVTISHDLPDMLFASGFWNDAGEFEITIKYIETCYVVKFLVKPSVSKKAIEFSTLVNSPFSPDNGKYTMICSKEYETIT